MHRPEPHTEPTAHGREYGIFFYRHWKGGHLNIGQKLSPLLGGMNGQQRFEDEHGNQDL